MPSALTVAFAVNLALTDSSVAHSALFEVFAVHLPLTEVCLAHFVQPETSVLLTEASFVHSEQQTAVSRLMPGLLYCLPVVSAAAELAAELASN